MLMLRGKLRGLVGRPHGDSGDRANHCSGSVIDCARRAARGRCCSSIIVRVLPLSSASCCAIVFASERERVIANGDRLMSLVTLEPWASGLRDGVHHLAIAARPHASPNSFPFKAHTSSSTQCDLIIECLPSRSVDRNASTTAPP
jgi:hypothetical protein